MQPMTKAERWSAPYDDDEWYGNWVSPELDEKGMAWNSETERHDTPVIAAGFVVAMPCDQTIAFATGESTITIDPGAALIHDSLEDAFRAIEADDEFVMAVFDVEKFQACKETW